MTSLQSTSSVASGLGGVRQRFDSEYLAKQLPVFQERAPRVGQESPKYPTDAPPNLPLPPVLPGEEILMMQHRVACLDTFAEPAVGSLYITNFRLIFNGNSISDPESREAIQEGLPIRKEHAFSLDSGRLPRIRTTRSGGGGGNSATFNSYLTNPEQPPPIPSKWRLNSLRRSNRSTTTTPEATPTSSSANIKKSVSLRRSTKSHDTTDGPGTNIPSSSSTGVWSDIGSVLNRGARSLRMAGKRKGIVNPDSAQWDSVSSVSSVSEHSECLTTWTDEASERDMDMNLSPIPPPPHELATMFTIGSLESSTSSSDILGNGSVAKSHGCVVPTLSLQPVTPTNSLDSGVITDPLTGSWITASGSLVPNGNVVCGTGNGNENQQTEEEVDFERYTAATLGPILENEAQRLELESSVDPSLLLNPKLERERQKYTRRSWFHKSNSPAFITGEKEEEDSASEEGSVDEEEDGEQEINRTLTQDSSPAALHNSVGGRGGWGEENGDAVIGYSQIEIIESSERSDHSKRSTSPVYSVPVKVTGRGGSERVKQPVSTCIQQDSRVSDGMNTRIPPSLIRKPLPPTPPKKPGSLKSSTVNSKSEDTKIHRDRESDDGRRGDSGDGVDEGGVNEKEREGDVRGAQYINFSVFKKKDGVSEEEEEMTVRDRSLSSPGTYKKKPQPLPRKFGTLGRGESDRGFGDSLPANFKPPPPPRKPTLFSQATSPSLSPRSHKRPPISQKPPSPSLTRATNNTHRHSPPTSSSHHKTTPTNSAHTTTSPSTTDSNTTTHDVPSNDNNETENNELTKKASPVAPPRRKRKVKTTPTHTKQPLSPIYSPEEGSSPVRTIGLVSSDAGSSEVLETSSESDLSSQPRTNNKFLPSPSPVPRSPSPFRDSVSPLGWHDDEQSENSSMVAQRHSIPSVRSSLPPPSPFDAAATYGYVGDREPLSVGASPYSTITRSPHSLSSLPTSTRYSFSCSLTLLSINTIKKLPALLLKEDAIRLPEGIIIQSRNFRCMKLHIHPQNRYDADGLKELLEKKILVEKPPQELFAFHYCAAIRHPNPNFLHTKSLPNFFKLRELRVLLEYHVMWNILYIDEMERLNLINSHVWHVSTVLKDSPDVTPSYPREVIVPRCIPDMDLLRGEKLYRSGRFPTLTWCSKDSTVFLLRAAPTLTHRGQTSTVDMRLDETILQAVCVSTEKNKGNTKLYIFTEKPDSTPAALSDPMHTSLTAAQKRAYYYQNCQFEYVVTPPTYKNLRHSFRKLTALLEESKVGEDEYLIALDDTRWLYRVQELLQTAAAVVTKLEEEHASVLVSYDSGRDRTGQITGLAQLLLDPYYRTMDGFQVLVQKEWLWFGHPFEARHTRHGRLKEDGPVFLQWVDCIWQIMQQCPSAFEFNEKFLMVLVESSYSGQFGTFLLDNEQERHKTFSDEAHKHKSVATHTLSFWTWVAMVNAAGKTFYNLLYDPDTFPWVIYPNCTVPCLKLWTKHYSQSKYQDHHSTNTTPLYKQLDSLVREYQILSRKVDISGSTPNRPPSISLPSSSDEGTRSAQNFIRERERVRHSGRSSRSKTPAQYETIQRYLLFQGIDSSVCKHAVIVGNTCQGYLVKLGGVRKHWQSRWFVLDFASQLLTYFESKEAYTTADRGTPKGVVELNEMSKVWQNTKKKEHLIRHVFTVETKSRTYLFRAPSLLTMQMWMTVLSMPQSASHIDST